MLAEQDVVASFHNRNRRPRVPNPHVLAIADGTAAASNLNVEETEIPLEDSTGVIGAESQDTNHVAGLEDSEELGETFLSFCKSAGAKKIRVRKNRSGISSITGSITAGPKASSRSRSVSTAPTLIGEAVHESTKTRKSFWKLDNTTKLAEQDSAQPTAVEDAEDVHDADGEDTTRIKFEDLPPGWQEVIKMAKIPYREYAAVENGFHVKEEATKKIEEFLLQSIVTFENEGGVLEDGKHSVILICFTDSFFLQVYMMNISLI